MKRRHFLSTGAGAIAASAFPLLARGQARPCPPSSLSVEGGSTATTTCSQSDAETDWLYRTGQAGTNPNKAGVVWFHDFRSDAEVNAFRWTPGYSGGNDPNSQGGRASWCRRNTSDGVTGGGCLEIFRGAGSSEGAQWWRPFSPMTAPGNGRASADPGANGSVPVQQYQATNGGSQIYDWHFGSRPGWYGHSSYHSGTAFDGTEFFLQMRVKSDPRRTTAGNSQVGKLLFLTTSRFSLTAQEIVTYSGAFPVAGGPNYHRMYIGGSPPLEDLDSQHRPGQQIGSQLANYGAGKYCEVSSSSLRANCWAFSGGWDTLLYHVTPGHNGVADTRIIVYAAHAGEQLYEDLGRDLRHGLRHGRQHAQRLERPAAGVLQQRPEQFGVLAPLRSDHLLQADDSLPAGLAPAG